MPYEVESPWGAAASAASAYFNGQEQARQRKLQEQQLALQQKQDAAIQAAQMENYRSLAEDRAAKLKASQPVDMPANLSGDLSTMPPAKQFALLTQQAQYAATQGNAAEAQRLTQLAAAVASGTYNMGARTAETQAKTATEQQRPALINAQTGLTTAKTATEKVRPAEIQSVTKRNNEHHQEVMDGLQEQLARTQMVAAAAAARAAQSQGAAFDRMLNRESFDAARDERTGRNTATSTKINDRAARLPLAVKSVLAQVDTGQTTGEMARTYIMGNDRFSAADKSTALDLLSSGKIKSPKASGPSDVQRASAYRAAVATLKRAGVHEPSDPGFPTALQAFLDPAQRAQVMSDPHMPATVRAYFSRLQPMVP